MISQSYQVRQPVLTNSIRSRIPNIAQTVTTGLTPPAPAPPPDTSPNGLGESIAVAGLEKDWFRGSAQTLTFTPPVNYTTTWRVYDSLTLAEITSGSGTTLSYTPTTLRWLDVEVRVTKGTDLIFYRYLRSAIKPLPPLFTRDQADLKVDLTAGGSGFVDLANVDRPGYKVYVRVTDPSKTWSGTLSLFRFYSSVAENPITVIIEPGTTIKALDANPFAFTGSELKNVFIHSLSDPGIPYGLKLRLADNETAGAQMVYIRGIEDSNNASSRTAPGMGSRGFTMAGVEVDGRNAAGTPIASSCTFQAQNFANDNFNYSNYAFDGINLFKWYIHHTLDEGFYIGRTGDSDNLAGLRNVRVTQCRIESTGNDSAQFGNCDGLEVFQCQFINAGTRNNSGQRDGLVINPGCRNWSIYQCLISGAPELMQTQTGSKGGSGEVFANVFVNRAANPPSIMYSRASKISLAGALSDIRLSFYNNTIVTPASNSNPTFFVYYNTGIAPTRLYPYIAANNLIVSLNQAMLGTQNVSDKNGFTIANYITNNIASPMFRDQANNDFRLSSTSSPAFGVSAVPSKIHFMSAYDYDGHKYTTPVRGAYSGLELNT
jgi:hypothetical protein